MANRAHGQGRLAVYGGLANEWRVHRSAVQDLLHTPGLSDALPPRKHGPSLLDRLAS